MIVHELSLLREHLENNNIAEVNKCINSLLSNPEFWILCYESIKSNPGLNSPWGSSFTGKAVTMDGIDLEFFHKLSIKISRGNFNFGPHGFSLIFSRLLSYVFKAQTGYIYHYTFLFLIGLTFLLGRYQFNKVTLGFYGFSFDVLKLFILYLITFNFFNFKS